jgi:hypothetical protein
MAYQVIWVVATVLGVAAVWCLFISPPAKKEEDSPARRVGKRIAEETQALAEVLGFAVIPTYDKKDVNLCQVHYFDPNEVGDRTYVLTVDIHPGREDGDIHLLEDGKRVTGRYVMEGGAVDRAIERIRGYLKADGEEPGA